MDRDYVIIEIEFQLESEFHPYGHFVCLRFIDDHPSHIKMKKLIKDMNDQPDVKLVDYNYIIKPINEATDISGLDVTIH